MDDRLTTVCTAFAGHAVLTAGSLAEVAIALRHAPSKTEAVLVFNDATGKLIDLDLRGTDADILERLSQPAPNPAGRYRPADPVQSSEAPAAAGPSNGRGRPKLGVVAREVTLLPRHWDWLATQPSGASATLRRLVDDARKSGTAVQSRRAAQDAAYHFMLAMAGDLPGYEEATRALFANDRPALELHIADWPDAIKTYALRLASGTTVTPASACGGGSA